LLDLAASHGCEVALAAELARIEQRGELPDAEELKARFAPRQAAVPEVAVELPTLAQYDELMAEAA